MCGLQLPQRLYALQCCQRVDSRLIKTFIPSLLSCFHLSWLKAFPFRVCWHPSVLKASSSFAEISKKVWHEGVFKWCNYIDTVVQEYCCQRNVWEQKLLLHMTGARVCIDTLWLLTLPPDGIMPSSVMIVNDNDLYCWSGHARGLS